MCEIDGVSVLLCLLCVSKSLCHSLVVNDDLLTTEGFDDFLKADGLGLTVEDTLGHHERSVDGHVELAVLIHIVVKDAAVNERPGVVSPLVHDEVVYVRSGDLNLCLEEDVDIHILLDVFLGEILDLLAECLEAHPVLSECVSAFCSDIEFLLLEFGNLILQVVEFCLPGLCLSVNSCILFLVLLCFFESCLCILELFPQIFLAEVLCIVGVNVGLCNLLGVIIESLVVNCESCKIGVGSDDHYVALILGEKHCICCDAVEGVLEVCVSDCKIFLSLDCLNLLLVLDLFDLSVVHCDLNCYVRSEFLVLKTQFLELCSILALSKSAVDLELETVSSCLEAVCLVLQALSLSLSLGKCDLGGNPCSVCLLNVSLGILPSCLCLGNLCVSIGETLQCADILSLCIAEFLNTEGLLVVNTRSEEAADSNQHH